LVRGRKKRLCKTSGIGVKSVAVGDTYAARELALTL
jgi:hypothetical protein